MANATLGVALNLLEEGDEFWIEREAVGKLTQAAYHFDVLDYNEDLCQVRIIGHADAPEEAADE